MNEKNELPDDFLSLAEAAEYAHVTRQAIYVAIRKRGLPAVKKNRQWCISRKDLDEYRANKYNRDKRKFNDEFIFDMEKGHFSVQQVCKVISATLKRPYSLQHIYYLMRRGKLKAFRMGAAWVIAKDDAVDLLEKERNAGGQYVHQQMKIIGE